jgi:hypothetical protein
MAIGNADDVEESRILCIFYLQKYATKNKPVLRKQNTGCKANEATDY